MKKIPIILDTDPGIDDAAAIAAALLDDEIDVKLITTVSGNVSVDKTTLNALKLVEFIGRDVPVARGAEKPLLRKLVQAIAVHGESGLTGYEFKTPVKKIESIHAVEAMKNTIIESEEPITIVAIAPLTNIALLFSLYPECRKKIKSIVLMGGSASRGNITPAAEFNFYVDPESAKIVFESGVEIVMCGLDVTTKALLTESDVTELSKINRVSNMLCSLFLSYHGGNLKDGLMMHDLCAVAYIVKPELFQTIDAHVDIETSGAYTAGSAVVDIDNFCGKPENARVCMEIDNDNFKKWFADILKKA